jgi:antitoxin (DNA-binding transcriptional repressor) of toxin-antitoxin stability system
MSRSITATNLRTDLREILLDLDAGPVEITKHGKVVAVLSRPIPADLLESSDPAVVCTTDESAPPCDTCADASDDAPAGAVEQHADEMRSRGALAVDASDEPLTGEKLVDKLLDESGWDVRHINPAGPDVVAAEGEVYHVEAGHAVLGDTEPVSASQSATEDEEPSDFTEEDDRNLEAEFDAWLAAGQPDDEIGEPAAW